ncbi:hypothetical protein BJX96DRAFT_186325 [Aspergillus floccosus]
MPPLPGFTDNPFQSRSDLVRAAIALVSALEPYKSKDKARIKVPVATGAGFDDTAAQLEGFARPLWVVPLLFGESTGENVDLSSWIQGLEAGTDANSSDYWGDLGDRDQRMVEMESIAFALLVKPDIFLGSMSDSSKRNLVNWLSQINGHAMPQNNWLWFRVFVNLVLVKRLGVSRDMAQHQIDADLRKLDSFRIGEGWSSDGLWGDERKQADYYSGSFAIQFAQMLYVRFTGDEDKARAEEYRNLAKEFGATFWRYFDPTGAAIPFGRSMTYRFAFAAFWSAVACADVELPAPFDEIGAVKGMLLRHLRWWSRCPDIFNSDGTLNIGFTYPNMYLSEAYNSPQSVYWCLKSFIVLMLPEDDKFWACPELDYPLVGQTPSICPRQKLSSSPSPICVIWPSRHILNNTPEHHFLLSSGQLTGLDHKAREAKYGKFAYSSAFGFSVPTGSILHQLAPDSTLCVSHDRGETWKLRSKPQGERITNVTVAICVSGGEVTVPALTSLWQPWTYLDLSIETALIPLVGSFPGWHVRVHRLRLPQSGGIMPSIDTIHIVDGGFALDAETNSGRFIPQTENIRSDQEEQSEESIGNCWLRSRAGTSGIADLKARTECTVVDSHEVKSRCFVLKPDPNTNLIASRTFIPVIQHDITVLRSCAENESSRNEEVWLASGVFAVAASAGLNQGTVYDMWLKQPKLRINVDHRGFTISVM